MKLFRRAAPKIGRPVQVYLHIGMNKTGTSAIQFAFDTHAAALIRHGLLYPRVGRCGPPHHVLSHALGFSHRAPPCAKDPAVLANLGPRLHDEIDRSGCSSVLMSSEFFVLPRDVGRVREFFEGLECRVVVYLRRHDAWWAASYSQGVKTVVNPPWKPGFETYLNFQRTKRPNHGNYRRLVDRWAEVFGAENLIVRPYESAQNQPSLVADLLHAIGRPDLVDVVGPMEYRNESLGDRELMVIELLQRTALEAAQRQRLIKAIRDRPGQHRGEGVIAPKLRRQLVEENLDDYAYIAERYLGRSDGRLFYEPLPDPDAPWTPIEPLSCTEAIKAIVEAMSPP